MGSGAAHMEARPSHAAGVFRMRDEATTEAWATMDREDEILADDSQGDHSTVSTEQSHDKKVFSSHPSPVFEAKTDPTSIPSGVIEDLHLERKCTESPLNSIEAVHLSDSVHSEQSDPSTGYSDSRESVPVAVNPGKVKAIGYHFGDYGTNTSTSRFHDPTNSWEAQHINDKIKQANGNSIKPTVSQSCPDLFLQTPWMKSTVTPRNASETTGPPTNCPHYRQNLPKLLWTRKTRSTTSPKTICHRTLRCKSIPGRGASLKGQGCEDLDVALSCRCTILEARINPIVLVLRGRSDCISVFAARSWIPLAYKALALGLERSFTCLLILESNVKPIAGYSAPLGHCSTNAVLSSFLSYCHPLWVTR